MNLRPMSITEARRVVGKWHRHNKPPQGGLYAIAAEDSGELVGVVIVGRPIARMLDDGLTCEVTRLATNGANNACSMLYGAAMRSAKALGYRTIYTYTLQEEPGTSLRASGWEHDADLKARPSWSCPSRPRTQTDMFGDHQRPPGAKQRWKKAL